METLIHTTLDADGVLLATIDMPDRTMNVFSADLMDAIDALMDQVDGDAAIKSVVVTSGKPTFLAGADLVMVRGYTDRAKTAAHDEMFAACGRLGRQFVRMEESSKPWVAAVNGIALGGGLELALACRVRLVTDEPRTQLGVPEVRWGLLPGAGGTQRLPRLAPFDDAMNMLLTGRSISPAEAVRLGIFARAVPAAQLVEEAKAVARSLHGQPYDVNVKFGRLAQSDIPAWSEDTAREIALKHGVLKETFDLYPAYSAIVDSVLKGARLSLSEATDVEMTQFLRLMFNPVAGNMVRTLFLERLRSERELAAPKDVRLESIGIGAISAERALWSEALAKVKLTQVPDSSLPADTIELLDAQGRRQRVVLRVLDDVAQDGNGELPTAVLAPAGPYGRVLEIIGADDAAAGLVAALAAKMWCLPWRTYQSDSLLQRLQQSGGDLHEQAQTVVQAAADRGAGALASFDVAACLAGVTPAWTGGPLMWAWSQRDCVVTNFDTDTLVAWTKLRPALAQACA